MNQLNLQEELREKFAEVSISPVPMGAIVASSNRIKRQRRRLLVGSLTLVAVASMATASTLLPDRAGSDLGLQAADNVDSTSQETDPGADPAPAGYIAVVADNGTPGYVDKGDLAASVYSCDNEVDCKTVATNLEEQGYIDKTGALTVPVFDSQGVAVGDLTRGVVYVPGRPTFRGRSEAPTEKAQGDNGVVGSVLKDNQTPASPEQAIEWQNRWIELDHGPIQNVYVAGKVTDIFTIRLGESASS